jgi:regulatory protein
MVENLLYKTALNKAMALCSRREYCADDIRNKLISWGVGTSDTEKIIETLVSENFINEIRYATAYVRDKFNYNKWGKIKIASYLRQKKIPSGVVKDALDSIDYEAYIKSITDLITAHKRIIRGKDQYELKAKLLRYGLSKGFESSLLYDILKDMEEQ